MPNQHTERYRSFWVACMPKYGPVSLEYELYQEWLRSNGKKPSIPPFSKGREREAEAMRMSACIQTDDFYSLDTTVFHQTFIAESLDEQLAISDDEEEVARKEEAEKEEEEKESSPKKVRHMINW